MSLQGAFTSTEKGHLESVELSGGILSHFAQKKQKGNGRICTNDDVFFQILYHILHAKDFILLYLLDLTCFLSLPMDRFRFPSEPAKGESRTSYREAALVRSLATDSDWCLSPMSSQEKTFFLSGKSAKRFDSGR